MSLCRINRAQILDDSFNLARADLLEYPTALANTEYLTQETDFIPWSAALSGFSYLENMMKRSPGFGDLKTYLLATLQPLYDRLGFQEIEGEKFYDEKLRIDLLAVLCRLGHTECNEYSVYLLDQWMSLPNPDEENPIPVSVDFETRRSTYWLRLYDSDFDALNVLVVRSGLER